VHNREQIITTFKPENHSSQRLRVLCTLLGKEMPKPAIGPRLLACGGIYDFTD